MISRRGEEVVQDLARQQATTMKALVFFISLRAGELKQSSSLIVARDARRHQLAPRALKLALIRYR